jgi:hypothetical protein
MLTAADLSFMRDTQEDALPGTVVIQRHTLVSDGMGGATETWAAVGTAIGRIYPRRTQSAENIGGGQVHSHMQWWPRFPWARRWMQATGWCTATEAGKSSAPTATRCGSRQCAAN